MMNWLNKILNVRSNEWSRLLMLFLILILANVGASWGLNVTYAGFLKQAGLRAGLATLTLVLLLSSISSILALMIYMAFVDRIDNRRLFIYITVAGGVIIVLGLGLLALNLPKLAFPLLYVLSLAWLAVFNPHFYTYINDLYDMQAAKRVLPLILAAGRSGAALAGFMLRFLTAHLPTAAIIGIWLLSDALIVAVIWVAPLVRKEQKKTAGELTKLKTPSSPAQGGGSSYLRSLQEGLNFTLQSKFLRWMAIGTLILAALMTLLEYNVNKILTPLPQFAESADYAAFLGFLDGVANLIALSILLFGLSRMTKAWGIGNTSLTFPIVNLLICGGLAAFPTLVPASLAHISRKGLRFSLQSPIEALLYNAIPLRIKGRARAFVGGLVPPIGVMAGVLLLLVELSRGAAIPWALGVIIALLALAYLISALVIRYQYTQALVKMLEEEDYSFLLSEEASELVVTDATTLQRLQKKLDESTSHEMRIFMTQLIAQVGGAESLSMLIPALKATTEPRTRAAMLNVLAAAGLRGDKVRELYVEFLSDTNAQVRQAAASGLEQLLGAKDSWLQEQWLNMVHDSEMQVSLYALQSLASTGEFYKFEPAVQKLDQLLVSDALEQKKSAINILGTIAQPRAIEQLLVSLKDENDQLRLEAILGLEKLTLPLGGALDATILEAVKPLLHDPVARARQAALKIIGRFKNKADYPLLISAFADKNPQVRALAADTLIGIGKDVLPVVQTGLESQDPQIHKMAAVVLSRVNPRQFASLIETTVSDNLNIIYQNVGLEQALTPYGKYLSGRVLLAALREINHELIDEVLYLLSAIHNPDVLKVVEESLNSDSPSTRNLALEALESLTSPRTAALIASLFEPSMEPAQLLQLGQGSWHIEQPDTVKAFEQLLTQTESRMLALLALQTLSEVGASLPKTAKPTPRKAAAARLLQALEKPPEQPEPASAEVAPDIRPLLEKALRHPDPIVQQTAQDALQKITTIEAAGAPAEEGAPKEPKPLSVIERVIILKEVPFFHNVPINQLEMLAMVCEEKRYAKDLRIFKKGDSGGILYIVADGQVGIEQEKRVGSALLATIETNSYFGEMTFFDNSSQSNVAVATRDSTILQLHRAPIIALAMQNPELALELINALSQRMRETSDRLADTARSRPRELHKLFDQF